MKATGNMKLGSDTIKEIFQWDVIRSAISAAFKKESWQRVFAPETIDEFLGRDLISACHLLCTLVILTICIICYKSGTYGGKALILGFFAYFNVFVGIVVFRNVEKFDMSRAIWWLLGMWAMAVGIGFILSSAWEGWGELLGTSAFVGLFALPVMMLKPEFWKQIFHAIGSTIDRALSGNSIEDIGVGLIGGVLGLMLGAFFILLTGAFIVISNYVSIAIEFCRMTGCRFARPEEIPQLADGVVAEDVVQAAPSEAVADQSEMAHGREEAQPQEEDDEIIMD